MSRKVTEFTIQRKMCKTCIYHKTSPLDLQKLENDVADLKMKGFFKGYRVCHHSENACCRGFWDRHKDRFTLGQLAQRLCLIVFVDEDTLK